MGNRIRKSTSPLKVCLSLPALILVLFASVSAAAGPASQANSRASAERGSLYFPLRHGYKWTYAVQSATSAVTSTWRVEVLNPPSAVPPMRAFFRLHGYFRADETQSVRTTPFGTVLERGQDGNEYLWYELEAEVGQSWKMHLAPPASASCEDGTVLTIVSRGEVISVPAGDFSRVLRVDRLTPRCADAGITSEWFAPEVGLIRRVEETIAGPIVSELVSADLGNEVWPTSPYTTALNLSSPRYVNNLMPPQGPTSLPRVRGAFAVIGHAARVPLQLVFSGCKSLTIEIRDEAGVVVRTILIDDGGCCVCDSLLTVNVDKEKLVLPFAFILADDKDNPLPDGLYSVTAILDTRDSPALRPAARARIEVVSVH